MSQDSRGNKLTENLAVLLWKLDVLNDFDFSDARMQTLLLRLHIEKSMTAMMRQYELDMFYPELAKGP